MNLPEEHNDQFEQERRDFLNSIFSLLKALAIHDLNNEALQRPWQNFRQSFEKLSQYPQADKGIEIRLQDGLLTILGMKINNHFSIVEASKVVPESMEVALIEGINFQKDADFSHIGQFFSSWALHCSVHQKPKALNKTFPGIQVSLVDPDKANLRLKTKSLLLSPQYALRRYYFLCTYIEGFFKAISEGKVISQKKIRRELLEMVEIAKANPYQLVALSLLRSEETGFEANITEAAATALLTIIIAKEVGFPIKDQLNLGLVGVMYNIGLLSQELSQILQSDKRLSQVEYKRVLDAQASGVYKLLKAQGASRPVMERLLSLFEATQGAQRPSVSLTLESRILRLASQYVALISQRPFRDAYTPSEAIRLLGSRAASKKEGNLDPVLYYIFVRLMGVYPVGSLVMLSNHQKAVVFRPSGEKFGAALIKLIEEEDQNSPGTLLDLSQNPELQIIKAMDPRREGISVAAYFFD